MKPYKKSAKYYDVLWGDAYKLRPETDIKRIETDIQSQIEFLEETLVGREKVLDVGCGTGRYAIPLAERGYYMTCVDNNEEMLERLRKKISTNIVNIHNMDMRKLNFKDEFDAITCMYTFNYLLTDDDISKTLHGMYNSLKKEGIVVIDVHNFLFHLGNFEKVTIDHFHEDGIDIQRITRYDIDNIKAICYYDEYTMISEEDGKASTYHEVHPLRMIIYNEMMRFLKEAGFEDIRCFKDYSGKEVTTSGHRLVFVGRK